MLSRGEGPKSDKVSLRGINTKERMTTYSRKVSDIGSKSVLQRLQCAYNVETVKRRSGAMVKWCNGEMSHV